MCDETTPVPTAIIALPCVALAGAKEFEPIGGGPQAWMGARKDLADAVGDYMTEYNVWASISS